MEADQPCSLNVGHKRSRTMQLKAKGSCPMDANKTVAPSRHSLYPALSVPQDSFT